VCPEPKEPIGPVQSNRVSDKVSKFKNYYKLKCPYILQVLLLIQNYFYKDILMINNYFKYIMGKNMKNTNDKYFYFYQCLFFSKLPLFSHHISEFLEYISSQSNFITSFNK
jgi:hypothetical protein